MRNIFQTSTLILLLLFISAGISQETVVPDPDPLRFEQQMKIFENWDSKNTFPENAVLFVGSSSIRLWKTSKSFPSLSVINRGFGGAHISDMIYFYDTIIKNYKPSAIVFYCGDNDIASGKSNERVNKDFKTILSKIREDFPKVLFYYIPVKPSESRWIFWPQMEEFNRLIQKNSSKNFIYVDTATPMLLENGKPSSELFIEDMLHLNEQGYKLWTFILKSKIVKKWYHIFY